MRWAGTVTMSEKELDRLGVVGRVAERRLTQRRAAVMGGEVSWTVARGIVAFATPENEEACLETIRGRTVRAVEAMIEALRALQEPAGAHDFWGAPQRGEVLSRDGREWRARADAGRGDPHLDLDGAAGPRGVRARSLEMQCARLHVEEGAAQPSHRVPLPTSRGTSRRSAPGTISAACTGASSGSGGELRTLWFELGVGRFRLGDRRIAPGPGP